MPPKLTLDTLPEIGDDMLSTLHITPEQFGDFSRAIKVLALQAQGTSYYDAIAEIGIPRNARYTAKWKGLFDKAARFMAQSMTATLRDSITAEIAARWPEVIRRQLKTAESGTDIVSLEAAKFLHTAYIVPAFERTVVEEDEHAREYLERRVTFNPMATLHASEVNSSSESLVPLSSPELPEQ